MTELGHDKGKVSSTNIKKGPGWVEILDLYQLTSVAEEVLGVMHTQEHPTATKASASPAGW